MSVIIRLQGLPLSAASVDVRRYFNTLNIPDGGVHIIGGDNGDAFIAFSSDEDARLAMQRNDGYIHDARVQLLLSSKTEMQKVIAEARGQVPAAGDSSYTNISNAQTTAPTINIHGNAATQSAGYAPIEQNAWFSGTYQSVPFSQENMTGSMLSATIPRPHIPTMNQIRPPFGQSPYDSSSGLLYHPGSHIPVAGSSVQEQLYLQQGENNGSQFKLDLPSQKDLDALQSGQAVTRNMPSMDIGRSESAQHLEMRLSDRNMNIRSSEWPTDSGVSSRYAEIHTQQIHGDYYGQFDATNTGIHNQPPAGPGDIPSTRGIETKPPVTSMEIIPQDMQGGNGSIGRHNDRILTGKEVDQCQNHMKIGPLAGNRNGRLSAANMGDGQLGRHTESEAHSWRMEGGSAGTRMARPPGAHVDNEHYSGQVEGGRLSRQKAGGLAGRYVESEHMVSHMEGSRDQHLDAGPQSRKIENEQPVRDMEGRWSDRHMDVGTRGSHIHDGVTLNRQIDQAPASMHMNRVPPGRYLDGGPPGKYTDGGPPDRYMGGGPPDKRMERPPGRNTEHEQPDRNMDGEPIEDRMDVARLHRQMEAGQPGSRMEDRQGRRIEEESPGRQLETRPPSSERLRESATAGRQIEGRTPDRHVESDRAAKNIEESQGRHAKSGPPDRHMEGEPQDRRMVVAQVKHFEGVPPGRHIERPLERLMEGGLPASRIEGEPHRQMVGRAPGKQTEAGPPGRHMEREAAGRVMEHGPSKHMDGGSADRLKDQSSSREMEREPGRQMESGPLGRYVEGIPRDRHVDGGPPGRHMEGGPPDRHMEAGPPGRHKEAGPPGRQMGQGGTPVRLMDGAPPSRQMGRGGPPDRQMEGGTPGSHIVGEPPGRYMESGPRGKQMEGGPPGSYLGGPRGGHIEDGQPGKNVEGALPSRQIVGGPPDRHTGGAPPGRHTEGGPSNRHMEGGPPGRHMDVGAPGRYVVGGPLGRHMESGPPGRHMEGGPPVRHMEGGPPGRQIDREVERHIEGRPPVRHMEGGLPGRQIDREVGRQIEGGSRGRLMEGGPPARLMGHGPQGRQLEGGPPGRHIEGPLHRGTGEPPGRYMGNGPPEKLMQHRQSDSHPEKRPSGGLLGDAPPGMQPIMQTKTGYPGEIRDSSHGPDHPHPGPNGLADNIGRRDSLERDKPFRLMDYPHIQNDPQKTGGNVPHTRHVEEPERRIDDRARELARDKTSRDERYSRDGERYRNSHDQPSRNRDNDRSRESYRRNDSRREKVSRSHSRDRSPRDRSPKDRFGRSDSHRRSDERVSRGRSGYHREPVPLRDGKATEEGGAMDTQKKGQSTSSVDIQNMDRQQKDKFTNKQPVDILSNTVSKELPKDQDSTKQTFISKPIPQKTTIADSNVATSKAMNSIPNKQESLKKPIVPPQVNEQPVGEKLKEQPIQEANSDAQNSALYMHVTNMPKTVSYSQIRRFFGGAVIPKDGIKMINNKLGERIGEAYLKFSKQGTPECALRKNGQYMEENRIKVTRCTVEEFNKAIDSYLPDSDSEEESPPTKRLRSISSEELRIEKPKPADITKDTRRFCVMLRGLPADITEKVIHNFLGRDVKITENASYIDYSPDGKQTGIAFIEVSRLSDYKNCMARHRSRISGCPIEVFAATTDDLDKAKQKAQSRNESQTPASPSREESIVAESNAKSTPTLIPTEESKPSFNFSCVKLQGLPFDTTRKHIEEFFSGLRIDPRGVHIIYNKNGHAIGDAFVEFVTFTDCQEALKKDRDYMGKRYVTVTPISKTDLLEQLRKSRMKVSESNIKSSDTNVITVASKPIISAPEVPAVKSTPISPRVGTHTSPPRAPISPRGSPRPSINPHVSPHAPVNQHVTPHVASSPHMSSPAVPNTIVSIGPHVTPHVASSPHMPSPAVPNTIVSIGPHVTPHVASSPHMPNPAVPNTIVSIGPCAPMVQMAMPAGQQQPATGNVTGLRPPVVPIKPYLIGAKGLPHNTTIGELLTFFRGYNPIPSTIRFHYSSDGRPTGDALIGFPTELEGKKVCRELKDKVLNRQPIRLFLAEQLNLH